MRFAMIGTGGVSNSHLEAFRRHPDRLKLVAACDVNGAAAAAFAQRAPQPAPSVFMDHLELLRAGPKLDAAIVTLPHFLHYPVARDFIEAGVPLLVEKPLACTLGEARQLRDLAAERRVPVMVGQTRRFDRDAIWVKQWVDADPHHFGPLRTFDLTAWQNVLSYTGGPQNASHWILDGKRAGGGVVISVGVHRLDVVRFLTGADYAEASATGRFDPPFHGGAESSAVAMLTMTNGAAGVLHGNYTAPRCPYSEAMTLFGESGTILQHVDRRGDYTGPYEVATTKGRTTTKWPDQYGDFRRVPEAEVAHLDPHPFVNQLVAFADALDAGAEPPSGIRENFNTVACLQAIYDSMRSGRTEKVATD